MEQPSHHPSDGADRCSANVDPTPAGFPAAAGDGLAGRRRPRGARLWLKLLLAYLVPTAAIGLGIGLLAHRASHNAMERQLGEALCATARTAALQVGRQRALALRPGDETSRTYNNLVEKLAAIERAAGVERIVMFDRRERCLLDSDRTFAIGEPLPALAANRAELQSVYAGRCRASVLFSGPEGKLFKTGYAPVRLDGRVVAGVGVDGSAAFFGPLSELSRTLVAVVAVALALVVLVTLVVSRRITRPLDRLTAAARAIGSGELEGEIRVETGDEIGALARTLNDMRQAILARDRQLQLMLSGIAHEVRNPLGGMSLFVGLLQEELSDPQAQQHVDRIASELAYLDRVVHEFLDFARNKPPQIETLDPRAELEQVRGLCQADAERAEVALDIEVDAAISSVRWDQERMRRAVLNLVRNAIQASEPGGRVCVALAAAGDRLLLRVTDRGRGIPVEQRQRIFEPFFTTRQKGTGLGLALVARTVASHGGAIRVDSQSGAGTTFELQLPATPRATAQEGEADGPRADHR